VENENWKGRCKHIDFDYNYFQEKISGKKNKFRTSIFWNILLVIFLIKIFFKKKEKTLLKFYYKN